MEMRIKTDKASILSREEIKKEKVITLKDENYGKWALAWLVLQGLVPLSSDMQTDSFQASQQLGSEEFDPKPSPLSPSHVCIITTANLTALSVNSSHTGLTGGSLLNLQATPSDVLLTRLAGKYTHYTLAHKHHFFKHLETAVGVELLGK